MSSDVRDLRRNERFVVREELEGSFAASEVIVLNLCEEGALISHRQPMRIGTRARLQFRRSPFGSTTAQARIVWSHLARQGASGALVYQSGLAIEADSDYVAVLNDLVEQSVVVPDDQSLSRRRQKLEDRERQKAETLKTIVSRSAADEAPDPTLLVRHAQTHLRNNPSELESLYVFARESAGDVSVAGDPIEVLAIWEYLERNVDVATIDRALRRR